MTKKKSASAKKSAKTNKKTATKKAVTSRSAPKKTAAAKKSSATTKESASRKSPATTPKKKSAQPTKTSPTKKAAATKKSLPKASDLMKRAAHTPAIFKASQRRSGHILLSMDEVREILKKRAQEEKREAAAAQKAAKATKKAPKATTPPPTPAKTQPAPEESAPQRSRHSAASLDDILGTASPGPVSAGPRKVPRKWKKYHDLLTELRNEVSQELNLHSNETLKKSQKDDAGDLSISVDAGTDNFDRDFALSLLSSEQEALKEIEAALQRIYNGTYGICEETGQPISDERLEAVPFTRFSLEGQRLHESQSRRRVDRPGAYLNDGSGDTLSFGDDDGDN